MRFFCSIIIKIRKFIIYKILRKTTHGVRVIMIKKQEILLIKHPYDNFWTLPGGGIKRYETSLQATKRETLEETGYKILLPIKKLGKYKNFKNGKRDFVTVYLAEKFIESKHNQNIIDKMEIEKSKWFNINSLPKTSASTKCRITEVLKNDYSFDIRKW